jgi:hypothetical protein
MLSVRRTVRAEVLNCSRLTKGSEEVHASRREYGRLITLAAQRLLGDREGESEGVLYALAARGRSDDNPASISSEVDELIDLTGVRGAASVR